MKSAAALGSSKVDGAGLIAALVNPDGALPSVEGCTARMIGLCCPSQPDLVVKAVAMVPEKLAESPSFDWLHDANGIRFLPSTGSWSVQIAVWKSARKFVEALVTRGGKTMYNDDPEATTRELIDALGVQLFGTPGSNLPVADSVEARTELVFSRALTNIEAAKVAKDMPVKWRPAIRASAKSFDEIDVEDGRTYELTSRRGGHPCKFVAAASVAAALGSGIAVYAIWKLVAGLLEQHQQHAIFPKFTTEAGAAAAETTAAATTAAETVTTERPVRRFWELVNRTTMSNIDLQSLKETDPDACQDGGDMMTYFDAWSWPIYNPCRSTKGLADAGNVFCIRMDGERGCFAFGPPYGFDLVAVRQGINDYWTPKECGIVCYDPKKATQVLDRALVERLGAGLSGPNLNITALNTQLNTEALVALKREVLGRYPLDPECSVGCEGCLGDSSEDAVNQLLKCFCDYVSVHCDGIDNEGLDTPMASSNAGFNTTVGQVLSQLQGPKDSKRVDSCLVECRRAQQ